MASSTACAYSWPTIVSQPKRMCRRGCESLLRFEATATSHLHWFPKPPLSHGSRRTKNRDRRVDFPIRNRIQKMTSWIRSECLLAFKIGLQLQYAARESCPLKKLSENEADKSALFLTIIIPINLILNFLLNNTLLLLYLH